MAGNLSKLPQTTLQLFSDSMNGHLKQSFAAILAARVEDLRDRLEVEESEILRGQLKETREMMKLPERILRLIQGAEKQK